eukprot:CAMPEP_0202859306 /NCGR_PEP_ID=MMETSP1391-20130828/1480_1 /ASSEMBLY_ACC=CAM_ASM_000867 /TAXON_ID=1034604 /ORGANISM="Chlamydomonas leiostraca, Strain SAG 11-49" /LENGTH=446 /DNA_ID=CAMNT_0049538329 /DNA_START=155 /DNA_END=1495 /DNA_ORIENTATION=+
MAGSRMHGGHLVRRLHAVCHAASPSQHGNEAQDPEAAVRAGWDPEGLFAKSKPLGDVFARKQQGQAASPTLATSPTAAAPAATQTAPSKPAPLPQPAAAAPPPLPAPTAARSPAPSAATSAASTAAPAAAPRTWPVPIRALPPAALAAGGVPGNADDAAAGYSRAAFHEQMVSRFIGIDLDYPGLRVLHLDPPVITVDNFLAPEVCQSLMDQASATGCMTVSKIGGGNAGAAGANEYDARRTSTSMLLDPRILGQYHGLRTLIARFHDSARKLMAPAGTHWGKMGVLPSPRQYCFESPQVAKYEAGQHFLAHEDAFPLRLARHNGFNRHGTLLMYLNDVPEGGATRFDHLGIQVQPKQGKALLFFPSFGDGRHDERTLHTATDAVHTKWVMQQWIARGFAEPAPPTAAVAAVPAAPKTFSIPVSGSGSGGNKGKGGKAAKKGFGGK